MDVNGESGDTVTLAEHKLRLKEADERLADMQREAAKLQERNVLLQQDLHEVCQLTLQAFEL